MLSPGRDSTHHLPDRSGTTFALFFFGVTFYYALIVALWVLVMIGLVQGSIGFDWIGKALTTVNPQAQIQLAQYAPIVAALIIVVASQFRQVLRINSAARAFCFKLAAIPREADRLAVELAQGADFQPAEKLRNQVTRLISENISPQALNFSRDGTLPARFTRAVALYNLFVGPRNNGMVLEFAANGYSRSAYARIMQLDETVPARADARYEELMHTGLAFFTSSKPTPELKEALKRNIVEVSNLTCSLVARYVLFCERTHNARLQRLAGMGFDARPTPTFGPDQWATTILLVIILSVGMMVFMPGTNPIELGKVLTIAIAFGVSTGFAVLGAIVVAQRFIERHEGDRLAFPPIAELILAALIVAGLSIASANRCSTRARLDARPGISGHPQPVYRSVARGYHSFHLHGLPRASLFLSGILGLELVPSFGCWGGRERAFTHVRGVAGRVSPRPQGAGSVLHASGTRSWNHRAEHRIDRLYGRCLGSRDVQ